MKINPIILLVTFFISIPICGMNKPISVPLKTEITNLVQAELKNNSTDLSRKSDYKLQQIILGSNYLLSNNAELASIAKTLKTNVKTLINFLNLIAHRAQYALNLSAQRANLPPAQEIKREPAPLAAEPVAIPLVVQSSKETTSTPITPVQPPAEPVVISKPQVIPEISAELLALIRSEMNKITTDLSGKSPHELQQLIVLGNRILEDKAQIARIAQTLTINAKYVPALLSDILQRAQTALDIKAQKTSQPPAEVVAMHAKPAAPQLSEQPAPKISLWQAADKGDIPAVKWHLAHGSNINGTSPGGESALALAASGNHKEIVTLLIKAGADLNLRNLNGHSALLFAVFRKNTAVAQELIDAGADVNLVANGGMRVTPLKQAALHGDEEMVRILIAAGAGAGSNKKDPTVRDLALMGRNKKVKEILDLVEDRSNYLDRPKPEERFITKNNQKIPSITIWQAAAQGDLEILKWYLDHGADGSAADIHGETPISLALQNGQARITLYLTQRGIYGGTQSPVHQQKTKFQKGKNQPKISIWQAAADGDIEAILWHLNNGVSVNAPNEKNETPLIVAAAYNQPEVVKQLILSHAKLNETDEKGNTALIRALEERSVESAKALIDAGANVTIRNKAHQSALHFAVSRGLGSAVQELLSHGADPKEKDENDFTLVMLASYLAYRNSNIIPLLVAAGADVHATDDTKTTALMVAAARGYAEPAQQLLNAGARIDDQDITGRTAVDYAYESTNEKTIKLLRDMRKASKRINALAAQMAEPSQSPPEAQKVAAPAVELAILAPTVAIQDSSSGPVQEVLAPQPTLTIPAPEEVPLVLSPVEPNVIAASSTPATTAHIAALAVATEPASKLSATKKISIIRRAPQPVPAPKVPTPKASPVPAPKVPALSPKKAAALATPKAPAVCKAPAPAAKPTAIQIKKQNLTKGGKGNTPLIKAAKKGNVAAVRKILKEKPNINAQNNLGETALLQASRWGNTDIARLLLEAGANPNVAATTDGMFPLLSAAAGGHVQIARLLIDNGANINAQDSYRGRTPLLWTVRMTVGSEQKTAVQVPVEKSAEMLNLLLSRGANPLIRDQEHATALQWAQRRHIIPLVQILEKAAPH